MNKQSIIWILLACLTLGACLMLTGQPSQRTQTLTNLGFDTSITYTQFDQDVDFEKALYLVKKEFKAYDQLFKDQVDLLNQQRHLPYQNELAHVLKSGLSFHQDHPNFDLSHGQLYQLWKQARIDQMPPSQTEIEQSLNVEGNLLIDQDIKLTGNIQLDLGSIAKGYAVQAIKEKLEALGVKSAILNAGGNVVLIGHKPNEAWTIGIQDPDHEGALISFRLNEPLSIVTSGDYQRYFTYKGQRYGHIIDPQTGYPYQIMRSVTVITKDSMEADMYSTLLFSLSLEDGLALAKEKGLKVIWVFDQPQKNVRPDWRTSDYAIYSTKDLDWVAPPVNVLK